MVLTRSRIGFPTARIRDAWRRAVLIAALLCGLFAARVHAMEAPDSLGLARLAKPAGRSGTARMHVQWDGKWYTFSNMRFDATGLRGDARAKAVIGVSEVWEGNAPAAGIPWHGPQWTDFP